MRLFSTYRWHKIVPVLGLVVLTFMTALLLGQPLSDGVTPNKDNLRQLVQILGGAYQNALMHDSAKIGLKTGLEANDQLMEEAAIKFSSGLLDELKNGACSGEQANGTDDTCPLDDPSLAFGDWTEMISYAAYRLGNVARSGGTTGQAQSLPPVTKERIEAMEHLYRMVFAISKIHFDRSQSGTYLDAAQEQLAQARTHIEAERNLCECDASGYAARLQELSLLGDQMNDARGTALQ